MTYHVDLLLDDERRSASPVNVGMALRLAAFTAVAAIVLLTMMLFVQSRDVQLKAAEAKSKLDRLQPKYKAYEALRASLNELRASSRQVEACRRSRLAVGAELAQLQLGLQDERMQVTALRLNQFVGNQKAGAAATRSYEMRISGKLTGDDPKGRVDELIRYLSSAAYTGRVESVVVAPNGFRKESVKVPGSTEPRIDWYFELVCRFRPRSFE